MRLKSLTQILTIALLTVFSIWICPGQTKHFGWDLDYSSLLTGASTEDSAWVKQWLASEKSPAKEWIDTWNGAPIISSILIDYPAFHAAERTTIWIIRTANGAHYREHIETTSLHTRELDITPNTYDRMFKEISSWTQNKPKTKDDLPGAIPGYMGFISVYGKTGSHQMMLTTEDFVICLDVKKGCEPGPDKLKQGRLLTALEPTFGH